MSSIALHPARRAQVGNIVNIHNQHELDRVFSIWEKTLLKAHGTSLADAAEKRELYRYVVRSVDRLEMNSLEIHIEFAANAVYGIEHLPHRRASIVVPLSSHGEVNAPPGLLHHLTDFIVTGGIQPDNYIGTDSRGDPRVYWDSFE